MASAIVLPSPCPPVDLAVLRAYRLGRVIEQMAASDVALLVLVNPASLRYAADWREYGLFQSRIQTFDLFVEPDGRLTLFGGYSSDHPTIDELRPSHAINSFDGGLDLAERARRLADDVRTVTGTGARVAVEQVNPEVTLALVAAGLEVVDGEPLMEAARHVKSAEEIACIRHSIAVAEHAMARMREAIGPGITENELYAVLHQVNVANDGEWIDGRMLCSGPRTNPWFQLASGRAIEVGDLLAFDTDMIGPFGYTADISRTWFVGPGRPSAAQRDVYRRAHDEVRHNATLLEPGRSFREISDKAFTQEPPFRARRYGCVAHGVGMTDEYPKIAHREDWADNGYDGELMTDTVLSVESFVGSEHGGPGVKLEDMYLLTDTGPERLSTYPFDEELLR